MCSKTLNIVVDAYMPFIERVANQGAKEAKLLDSRNGKATIPVRSGLGQRPLAQGVAVLVRYNDSGTHQWRAIANDHALELWCYWIRAGCGCTADGSGSTQ
jgi:hypothetical protein